MQTYGLQASRSPVFAMREMLKRAEPIKVLSNFGSQYEVPKNSTDTIAMRRAQPIDFVTNTAASNYGAPVVDPVNYIMQDGVTPAARSLTYVDVTATLQEYGVLYKLSSKTYRMYEDRAIDDMISTVAEHMATLEEMICYGVVRAGTNVVFQNGTARNQVSQPVSLGRLRQCARALLSAHGKTITKRLAPGAAFGTSPVHPAFLVFLHSDLVADARNIPGFIPVSEYGSFQPVHDREIGAVEEFRFVQSPYFRPFLQSGATVAAGTVLTNGVSGSGAADVYPIVITGAEAWGQVALKGMAAIKPIVVKPEDANHGNPLRRFGFVGAEFVKTAVRLNENWMVRLEVAATVLS